MHIAVFGDTHGHLRLMFQLARLWQMHNQAHLDLILQCGDLGFFPDPSTLDKATKRYAKKDPEELGFARFFRKPEPPENDDLLVRTLTGPTDDLSTVRCPVLWCSGNHEDLYSLEQAVGSNDLVAVDVFKTLRFMQPGGLTEVSLVAPGKPVPGYERLTLLEPEQGRSTCWYPANAEVVYAHDLQLAEGKEETLRVGSVGGGPEKAGCPPDDYHLSPVLGWVGARHCNALLGKQVDVLVTHCGPEGLANDYASVRLREMIQRVQPIYHFYAHHGSPIAPQKLGSTLCVWLNDVNFTRSRDGSTESGCMGILEWHARDDHRFEIVEDQWFSKVSTFNWRHY